MAKKLFLGILAMVLILPLSVTACGIIPGTKIATIESIYYSVEIFGEKGLAVTIKPTDSAKASITYTVDLYESDRFRDSKEVSWTESELQVYANKKLVFPIPEDEATSYLLAGKDYEDVFSIKIHE